MAEIEMERRPRRHLWRWVVIALVIVALGIGAWLLWGAQNGYGNAPPAAETPAAPATGDVNAPASGAAVRPETQPATGARTPPPGEVQQTPSREMGGVPKP